MGFQSQHSVLFKANSIPFEDIRRLIFKRFQKNKFQGEVGTRERPSVAIDANLLGYLFLQRSCGAIGGIRIVCQTFTSNGIDVVLVADGPNRHHSKRATIERSAQREIANIEATKKRIELTEALQMQTDPNDATISNISKTLRALEKKSSRKLPENFLEAMKTIQPRGGTEEVNAERSPKIRFIESVFQADPEVAGLALSGAVEAIVSGDSDFAIHCGPETISLDSGSQYVDFMLAKPKISLKDRDILSFDIITGQSVVAEATAACTFCTTSYSARFSR